MSTESLKHQNQFSKEKSQSDKGNIPEEMINTVKLSYGFVLWLCAIGIILMLLCSVVVLRDRCCDLKEADLQKVNVGSVDIPETLQVHLVTQQDDKMIDNVSNRMNFTLKTEKSISTDYVSEVLFYLAFLIIVLTGLGGYFSILHRVIKSENEMRSKLFETQKDLYREIKMWELAKAKNDNDLDYKKRCFEEYDKAVKLYEYVLEAKELSSASEKLELIDKINGGTMYKDKCVSK